MGRGFFVLAEVYFRGSVVLGCMCFVVGATMIRIGFLVVVGTVLRVFSDETR